MAENLGLYNHLGANQLDLSLPSFPSSSVGDQFEEDPDRVSSALLWLQVPDLQEAEGAACSLMPGQEGRQQVVVLLDEEAVLSGKGARVMMVGEAHEVLRLQGLEEDAVDVAAEVW